MIRRPPRSTQSRSSAASDVYKRQIFNRPDSRFFKKAYVDRTHAFFERYGGRAIVLAQFVPFVRTYIPVAAGVGKMTYPRFVRFNVIGALVWGVGVTMLGYWLGRFD